MRGQRPPVAEKGAPRVLKEFTMVRVALTGLGFMGKTHLGVYQRLPEVQVAAVCDGVKERLAMTSLDAGGNIAASGGKIDLSAARKYSDYDAMLGEGGFDIVDICLPTYLHAAHAIKALDAGYHVFCEKPMALNGAETDKILAAVKRSGKLFSVGQCLRFWPAYTEVKKLLDSGRWGKLQYAEYARFSAPPGWGWESWLLDGKRSGNAALDLHVHDVDMLLYLHGKPRSLRSNGVFERDGSISHIATLYTYDGFVVTSTGGWNCSDSFGFNMRAFWVLEGATIELDFSKDPAVMVYPKGEQKYAVTLLEGDGYYHELKDFVEGVSKGRGSGVVTGESAAQSVKLCLLEIESAQRRKELSVRL